MSPPTQPNTINPSSGSGSSSSASATAGGQHTPPPPAKQRKLNRSLPQLKRNAACLPCRRRRIKCDAGKPHCSSCVRSYHFLARTQPDEERDSKGIQCFYDDDAEEPDGSPARKESVLSGTGTGTGTGTGSSPLELARGTKRKDGAVDEDPRDVIKALEEKVAELQQALAATSVSSKPSSNATSLPPVPPRHVLPPSNPNLHTDPNAWTGPPPETYPLGGMGAMFDPVLPAQAGEDPPAPAAFDLGFHPLGPGDDRYAPLPTGYVPAPPHEPPQMPGPKLDATVADDIDGEAGKMGGPFLDLLWPGWPPKLPTPAMLDHLVDTFFTSVPSVPRSIHRQSFLARLALPPTHRDFPHIALLHAICAAAARYTAAVRCRSVSDSIEKSNEDARRAGGKGLAFDDPTDETCFSERNARYALQAMRYEHVSPRGLLDILQAKIIMGHWGQSNARWIEGWIMIGGQARLAICLGLLDQHPDDFGAPTLRQAILPPPKSDSEREERRAVMYFILSYDIISSSSSGWPNTLPVEEVSARMPCSREDFDGSGPLPENTQNYHSPDLYTRHPVVDGFVMMIKGQILLGRACKFIRKCRLMEPSERPWARELPEFKQIDGDIAAFNTSFPAALRDPVQYMHGFAKGLNADLIAAHLVPRIASIFLHEPFADLGDPSCPSAARLLIEARACLNIVYLLCKSDIAHIASVVSYVLTLGPRTSYFFTAARTLVLFFQQALENADRQAAYAFRSEISVFKMAFSGLAHRFVMGARHLIMIEMMVRHVEEDILGHSLPDTEPINVSLPGQPPAWQIAHPDLRRAPEAAQPGPRPVAVGDGDGATSGAGPTTVPESEAEKYYFPDTHPDGMLASKMHTISAQPGRQMSVHEALDQRRGFVRSPMDGTASASASATSGSSNGPSPVNALAAWPNHAPSSSVGPTHAPTLVQPHFQELAQGHAHAQAQAYPHSYPHPHAHPHGQAHPARFVQLETEVPERHLTYPSGFNGAL